ncbi:MAG: leucine--tRNA ligase [Planctomycetes bacterium]|nr:leucine--tRNA ligase [Planctomycetota bacterium]
MKLSGEASERAQMAGYDFAAIEKKWQEYWEKNQTFLQPNPGESKFSDGPKFYVLDMFPYPSGAGLHVGHPEGYTATDIIARYKRMRGFNVLHPMGYDAFGLPAEQYAVEHGVHPAVTTQKNIANIERQIKMFGFSYDWSRRVSTTDPEYYRWTQWIFLQMFNSWYDGQADAARPIDELIEDLHSGDLLIDQAGNAVPAKEGDDERAGQSDEPSELPPGCARFDQLDQADQKKLLSDIVRRLESRQLYLTLDGRPVPRPGDDVAASITGMQGGYISFSELSQTEQKQAIEDIKAMLEDGQLVIAPTGQFVDVRSTGGAAPTAMRKFSDLAEKEQRQIIDNHRLAYMAEVPVNWCPKLGTVLANEEVTNEGRSDRGDHPVFRRALNQWMLRITAYSERLLDDLSLVDWPEPIKLMQRNWIGRSEGAEVDFRLADGSDVIRVFTTRPDTLFGATYMVLAPEHPLVDRITTSEQRREVVAYVGAARNKSDMERTADTKEKTGVFTGAYAINPVNEKPIPIWVADYVLTGYGTGAIMAVPAHDTRDFEFANKFNLPIIQVVKPPDGVDWRGFVGDGIAVNSGQFDGLATDEFIRQITVWLEERGIGQGQVNYKLRDWLFSRQRYWGEPFPIIHCDKCGTVGLPEKALPVLLPEMADFTPASSDDPGAPPRPPLGKAADWLNTKCPCCGGPAKRELNTMPQWAGSCWYYLRYLDPENEKCFCDATAEEYWMGKDGADLYVGGAEHAVLHLLYSRFWHKVLFDLGHVSTPEPFGKLFNQGMIRSFAYRDKRGVYIGYGDIDFRDDGAYHKTTGEKLSESVEKMSKGLKNVVNPDDIIAQYGADTFRLYEMFMGPLDASKPWNTRDISGVHRFLQRVWRMIVGDEDQKPLLSQAADPAVEKELHKLIKKASEDIEAMKFNTAIAAMMEFINAVYRAGAIDRGQAERFVLVLGPFAPHVAEELWHVLGNTDSLAYEDWPRFNPAMVAESAVELPVQINGKLRSRINVPVSADQEEIVKAALDDPKIAAALEGKQIVKKIVVPGKMVNIVVK